jgi:hypothetical protein
MTMKMIAAAPIVLLTLGVLGCSQQANTAPAVDRPAAATAAPSETNMFGENKDAAAGNAANARAAAYSSEPAPAADSAASTGTAAESAPPK